MASWSGGFGFGLGHSLGQVEGSVAAFTYHASKMNGSKREEESPDSKRKEVKVTQMTLCLKNKRLKTVCSDVALKY